MSGTGLSQSAGLPEGWVSVRLADVLSEPLANGRSVRDREGGFPVLRLTALKDGWIDLSQSKQGAWTADEAAPFCVVEGDFLLSRGNGSLSLVGRGGVVGAVPAPVAFPDTMIRVRPDRRVLDSAFLRLIWQSPMVRSQIESRVRTTAGIYKLNQKILEDIHLLLPPLSEQERIVESLEVDLSRLDTADKLLRKSTLRVTRLKHSVTDITLGFHVGDESEAAPFPSASGAIDGSLPMLPKEWSWRRLGEIADVVGGVTKDSKKQQDPSLPEVPYLRVANVQRGHLDLDRVTRIRVPQKKLDQLRLLPGDVLMNEGGDRDKLGRGWVWRGAMDGVIHQNHVFRARMKNEDLLPKLLSWWANSMGRWFEKNGKQSTNLASISLKKMKELPVPVPPADVQLDILKRIEGQSLNAAKAEEALRLAQRRSTLLRKALLRKAFSGGLVAQHPEDEPAAAVLDRIRAERAAQPKPKRTRARKAVGRP
ncbi:restriction endonuclease subunit S [Streptomyces sp. NPDC017230]|uniref:restriction endonuclease subunit S n=1 Tax=unclassified Streptomyces TaxID=2593676 RepID=UPI0037962F85